MRTIQLLHIIFFTDVLSITQRVTSLEKACPPLLGAIIVFWGLFWDMLFYFWELFPILSFEILYRCFLYYSDSQWAKKNFTACIPLLGPLCSIFGTVLSIFINALRNLKCSLDILNKCLDNTAVVTKLKNVLSVPLLHFFGVFLVYFVVCFSKNSKPSDIFISIFIYFLKCKVIAAVGTEWALWWARYYMNMLMIMQVDLYLPSKLR